MFDWPVSAKSDGMHEEAGRLLRRTSYRRLKLVRERRIYACEMAHGGQVGLSYLGN